MSGGGIVAAEKNITVHRPASTRELFLLALLAISVSGLCYYFYYLIAPWVWSKNMPFNPASITSWKVCFVSEHDGIEIYALYVLMFINCGIAAALAGLMSRLTGKMPQRVILSLCMVVACFFVASIGFTPPMNTFTYTALFSGLLKSLTILAVVLSLIALLYYLQQRSGLLAAAAVAMVLIPVCFIAVGPISWDDYSYIFAPALRLLNGAAIHDIYFQYELLPSMLAAAWMKLGWDLNSFQILGQAAYYFALLSVFLLSGKLFHKKELAVFLVAALILGRIYASPAEVVACFQVTPLRLDLWLPLLAAVYYYGPFHWSVGLICGLLLVLLKNFGIIYSMAYIQLLLTLLAISCFESDKKALGQTIAAFGRRCFSPIIIVVCFGMLSHLLFKNAEFGNYAGYYQKIGIGFIKIAANSFYWYVPALFSVVLILLFRMRTLVSPAYLNCGLLLTYCAIGNSIYFFGRSHEHNILNIAIVLLFLLFFMFDLISRFVNDKGNNNSGFCLVRRYGAVWASAVVICVITLSYAQNIEKKVAVQFINSKKVQLIFPSTEFDQKIFAAYLDKIKILTNNSRKVYFIDTADFNLYYYGGYAPVGYCNPFQTWIFKRDVDRFLQGLLDNGYYLVCNADLKHVLYKLSYKNAIELGQNVVVSK